MLFTDSNADGAEYILLVRVGSLDVNEDGGSNPASMARVTLKGPYTCSYCG